MTVLETTQKIAVSTEDEARAFISSLKSSNETVKKASYERKDKKAKGEIIATKYVITVTIISHSLWGDDE